VRGGKGDNARGALKEPNNHVYGKRENLPFGAFASLWPGEKVIVSLGPGPEKGARRGPLEDSYLILRAKKKGWGRQTFAHHFINESEDSEIKPNWPITSGGDQMGHDG